MKYLKDNYGLSLTKNLPWHKDGVGATNLLPYKYDIGM